MGSKELLLLYRVGKLKKTITGWEAVVRGHAWLPLNASSYFNSERPIRKKRCSRLTYYDALKWPLLSLVPTRDKRW